MSRDVDEALAFLLASVAAFRQATTARARSSAANRVFRDALELHASAGDEERSEQDVRGRLRVVAGGSV